MTSAYIHPTALVESGVTIGEFSSIWDSVHIRRDTNIGHHCIVGEKTHISYDVRIGNFVKINAFVYICTSVTIEDGVMISAGCIFTNDKYPRATDSNISRLLGSGPDEHTESTLVRAGATLGAGCIIGCGLTIGRFAMIGMGSLVTKSLGDYHLSTGRPAKSIGYVCRCNIPFARFPAGEFPDRIAHFCSKCERHYSAVSGVVTEASSANA